MCLFTGKWKGGGLECIMHRSETFTHNVTGGKYKFPSGEQKVFIFLRVRLTRLPAHTHTHTHTYTYTIITGVWTRKINK